MHLLPPFGFNLRRPNDSWPLRPAFGITSTTTGATLSDCFPITRLRFVGCGAASTSFCFSATAVFFQIACAPAFGFGTTITSSLTESSATGVYATGFAATRVRTAFAATGSATGIAATCVELEA